MSQVYVARLAELERRVAALEALVAELMKAREVPPQTEQDRKRARR